MRSLRNLRVRRSAGPRRARYLVVVVIVVALAYSLSERRANETVATSAQQAPRATTIVDGVNFGRCAQPPHFDCVVDGDTFYYGNQSIRIEGIDAPEINPPQCTREAELGAASLLRLLELLNAGSFEIVHVGEDDVDQYGRQLRIVLRGGMNFGDILKEDGLALPWTGRHQSWCE